MIPSQPTPPLANSRRRTSVSPVSPTKPFSPNKPWSNHNGHGYGHGGGHYGYSNPHQAMSNYGGKLPHQTGYGYSGANAMGSGAKVALALGGGILAGAVGAHLLGQLSPHFPHIHNPLDL